MRVPVFEYRLLAGSSIARFVGPQKWHHPFTATVKSVCRLSVCVKVCVWVQASGLKGVMAVRVDGAQSHMYMCWLTEGWSSALNRDICSQWSDIRCFPSQLNYSLIHQRERERQTTVEGGREGVRQREGDRMPAEKRCDTQWDKKTAAGSKWQTW